jgi:hypothetical protein
MTKLAKISSENDKKEGIEVVSRQSSVVSRQSSVNYQCQPNDVSVANK